MEYRPKTTKTEAEWQALAERDAAMWRRIYEYDAEMELQAALEAADRYQEKLRREQQPEKELTATEILERDWINCPGDVKEIEWYRKMGFSDEKILQTLRSFA